MLFSPNEQLNAAVKDVMAFAAHLNRGDLLSYRDLELLTNARPGGPFWRTAVAKVKRAMLDTRGIKLACVTNTGYRLMTVEEQSRDDDRIRRGRRQIGRHVREKQALPTAGLPMHLRLIRAAHIDEGRAAWRQANRALRNVSRATSNTMPRPQVTTA